MIHLSSTYGSPPKLDTPMQSFMESLSPLERGVYNGSLSKVKAMLEGAAGDTPSQRDKNRALIMAIKRKSLETARLLLQYGADPSAADEHGSRPLVQATYRGDAAILDALLTAGADVHAPEHGTLTPLINAVCNGHADCVQRLLQAGADPCAPLWKDEPPLIHAAHRSDPGIVALLLEAGADAGARGYGGKTAMMVTACSLYGSAEDKVRIVRTLLSRKANVDELDGGGNSALHWAAANGRLDCVRELLAGDADVNLRDHAGRTPLFMACYAGLDDDRRQRPRTNSDDSMAPVIDALLEAGAEANLRVEPTTLLNTAVAARCAHVVQRLVEHGADVRLTGRNGHTPLFAATDLHTSMTFLIRCGADVHACDHWGRTALMATAGCWRDATDSIKALIRAGCHVNAQDYQGSTALMAAASTYVSANVEVLLTAGADTRLRDHDGRIARDYAQRGGHSENVRLLDSHTTPST